MKKKWIVSCFALVVVGCIVVYFLYPENEPKSFLTKEELEDPALLESTKAILYFSTTADQDLQNDGMSYAVFIDKKGQAKLWKMAGLELGTVFATHDQLFLEEKSKVHIVGEDGVKTIDMPIAEHTGEVTGFNESDGQFYSVYNSGFTGDGGYHSNVRIGNAEGFETIHIPHYLHSSGMTDTDLFMLTDNGDMLEMTLHKMPLQEKVEIEDIATLNFEEERIPLSSILYSGGDYYIVMSNVETKAVDVYRINEQTNKIDMFNLYKYKSDEDLQVKIPYNLRKSAELVNGIIYYVDGVGDVYSFDTVNEQTEKAFTLNGASIGSMKMSEQLYFEGDQLHFYRYHESTKSHAIDTYDLKDRQAD